MFMHVEWYSPDWIFHHMFVTCCACIVWPGIFPTRGCWNGFYGTIETGIITVSATCVVSQAISAIVHGDMCSQPSHLCHSSCYVHVVLSSLVIFLCVCDMLYMYYLLTVQ